MFLKFAISYQIRIRLGILRTTVHQIRFFKFHLAVSALAFSVLCLQLVL